MPGFGTAADEPTVIGAFAQYLEIVEQLLHVVMQLG